MVYHVNTNVIPFQPYQMIDENGLYSAIIVVHFLWKLIFVFVIFHFIAELHEVGSLIV